MKIVECEQGTPDWFQCRIGCVTSSRIAAIVKKRQRGKMDEPLAERGNLKWELVGEILTGDMSEHYVSEYMETGKEREPDARRYYESQMDCLVREIGYVYHHSLEFCGMSPDGIVYDGSKPVGVTEYKCPKIETHLKYMRADCIPKEYVPQLIWQLACEKELLWADFNSYHPALRPEFRLFRKRLWRSDELPGWGKVEALISGFEADAQQFLTEVAEEVKALKESRTKAAAEYALA